MSETNRAWALAEFAAAGRPDDVAFHGRLPSRQSWEAVEGAWAGLALLHETPAYRAAVPTKVYEYAAAGLATLAAPLPRVQGLLEHAGGGAVAGGAEQVSVVLRCSAEDPEQVHEYGRRARAWALAELAGTTPFAEFADHVRRLLEGGQR